MRNVDENNETLSNRSLIEIFKVGTMNQENFANMLSNDSKLTWPHLLNITHLTNLTELSFSTKHPFQLNLIGLIFLKWWLLTLKCFNLVNLNIYYFSRKIRYKPAPLVIYWNISCILLLFQIHLLALLDSQHSNKY